MKKIFKRLKKTFSRTDPAFGGTGQGRLRAWYAPSTGPNTSIVYSVRELRNRSRDLTRNFPYLNGAYETVSSNIVGPGINVMPRHEDCAICDRLRELWDEWCSDCDIEGVNDFTSMLSLAVRERWEAGEAFLRFIPTKDGTIPLKLQLLQADQCKIDENHINPDGTKTIAGVKVNEDGTVCSYIIYKNHPGEALTGDNTCETIEIPADEICHYYQQLWIGQRRGIPEIFSAVVKAREMLEYDEAELNKKKMAAMMAAFVTTPNPDGVMNSDPDDPDADPGEAVAEITTGTITTLAPGEDIKFNPPSESGSSYEPFMLQNLRALAKAVKLTYEEFSNDMSKANFSSIRAGLNITQRQHRQEQNRLVHQIVRRVWCEFVKAAVISGAINIDIEKYLDNPTHLTKARFQAAGWPYVNPQQEVAANKEKVLCGFASRSQIIAESGFDAAEIDAQIAIDADRARKMGLKYTTDTMAEKTATSEENSQ